MKDQSGQRDLFDLEPAGKTTDDRPVFVKVIDTSDGPELPPSDARVNYSYLLTKSGRRVSGAKRNFVIMSARWMVDGQPFRWKRVFASRADAMAFGHGENAADRGWSGIDSTRELNRGLIMRWIP